MASVLSNPKFVPGWPHAHANFGFGTLAPDGVAKPGGPTETALRSALAEREGDGREGTGRPRRPRLQLGRGIGDGQANRSRDLGEARKALAWAGYYPAGDANAGLAQPTVDEGELLFGLQRLQRDFGLAQDGIMRPGGQTERALDGLIAPLLAQAERAAGSAGANAGQGLSRQADDKAAQSSPGKQPEDVSPAVSDATEEPQDNAKEPPTLNLSKDRVKSILEDTPARFDFTHDPEADDSEPRWYRPELGRFAVKRHDSVVQEMAEKHDVDPDMMRAILYFENARGHWYGLNDWADQLGLSDSKMPMNITPELWGALVGENGETLEEPEKNIEAAAILMKRITERLDDPTPEAIGSIWNGIGLEHTNDRGAHIGRIYREKPWLKDGPRRIPRPGRRRR